VSAADAATSETAAAAAERRGVAAGGGAIAAETVVVIGGPEGIGVPAAHVRIVRRSVRHSRAVDRVAGIGSYAVMGQAALVVGGIERPEVVINGVCRTADDNIAAAIVWVIEIRVIPAVPDKIVVPHHVGIAESKPHTVAGAEEGAVAETRIGRAIAVSKPTAIVHGSWGVISVGGIVVIEIGPAIVILGFHLDVLIIGRSRYIIRSAALAG